MDTSPSPTQGSAKQIVTSVYTPTLESISESEHNSKKHNSQSINPFQAEIIPLIKISAHLH